MLRGESRVSLNPKRILRNCSLARHASLFASDWLYDISYILSVPGRRQFCLYHDVTKHVVTVQFSK